MGRFVTVLAALCGVSACQGLLPERCAVNAPILHMVFGVGADPPSREVVERRLVVPDGFSIGLYARVPNARWLQWTGAGDLLVSVPRQGAVLLVEGDRDGDGRADGVRELLDELNRPHGLALRDGWLYVGETDAVGRVRFDAPSGRVESAYQRIVTGLPEGGNHWTRTVAFGPDGQLYVSVGSSCNACIEDDPRRAAILRFGPEGQGGEIFASGLRNAVGFDWRPGTDALYATENGRDLMGDDFPPDELNRVVEGGFYGWPYAHGENVPDPELGEGHADRIATAIPPVHAFRPHNAALGITFVRRPDAPEELRGAALVALHGSWNRTEKDGYQVVSLHWQEDGSIVERDFVSGFEVDEDVIGRPVDVAEGPDGAIYVSDDYAGAIWRVAYGDAVADAGPLPPAAPRGADALAALPARERAARAARGEALYRERDCARCHEAERAAPGVVVRRLEDLASRHSLGSLEALLRTPPPPMPVPALGAEERRDLAVFLLDRFE